MEIRTEIFHQDNLPEHLNEEIQVYIKELLKVIIPLMKNEKSLNYLMAAMSWVSFLAIKEFVAEKHQEKAALQQCKSILMNLEKFKGKEFWPEKKNPDSS